MREAMQHAGLCMDDIPKLQRDPAQYLGFIEVHIEQGPVLNELDIPLGVVTSINGGVRYVVRNDRHRQPRRHHAHGPPPRRRRWPWPSWRCTWSSAPRKTATAWAPSAMLKVPSGSINVVPGRCRLQLDLRAPTDAQRDAMVTDVLAELAEIAQRRGLRYTTEETMRAAAAPSAPALQQRWETRRGRPGRARCSACPAAPATTP